MVRPIYLTLAALLCLACAVSSAPVAGSGSSLEFPASRQAVQEEEVQNSSAVTSEESDDDEETEDSHKVADDSKEDDDEEDDDEDESLIRRRREVETTEAPEEETGTETPVETDKDQKVDATTAAAPVRKPVLVLIRDALKKVTTDLPTAQVANNALQYFQQFEHFIQQAIEEVIGDDDDEEETPVTVIPGAETEGEEIKKPEEEITSETQPEKNTEAVASPEKETPEPAKVPEQMASTSAPLSNAV
ncbi:neurofilament medium polypeptide [Drosophila bipectinata]|uniref:neurofilament medium polypeptide n=1 Tax=Drosophila bipectinata TaxID=42026 RepID=UPI001C8929C5|nr:nucleolin [Drosophila bipectinata]